MNQFPYGYQQAAGFQGPYPATSSPYPPAPAPQPTVPDVGAWDTPPPPAHDKVDDLRTGGLWLTGGLLATLSLVAYLAYKNENDHASITSSVNDYIREHSFRHGMLDERLGALEMEVRQLDSARSRTKTIYQEPYFASVAPALAPAQMAYIPSFQDTLPGIGTMSPSWAPTVRLVEEEMVPTLVMSGAPTRVMSQARTRLAPTRRAASRR